MAAAASRSTMAAAAWSSTRLAVAVAVAVAMAGTAAGDNQFGPEWIRIAACDSHFDRNSPRLKIPNGRSGIQQLAGQATQVRICNFNSSTDCVTSRPNSYPIMNLRNDVFLLGHQNNGETPCNRDCVQANWDGPHDRLNQIWSGCGSASHEAMQHPDGAWMFWACGNGGGLHFGLPQGPCDWAPNRPGANAIEVFIDAGSAPPTSAPTSQPTRWFESLEHETNVTEMQSRMTAAELSLADVTAALSSSEADRSRMMESIVDLTVTVNTMRDTLLDVMLNTSSIRQALVDAANSAPGSQSGGLTMPSISADGVDIMMNAPSGSIWMTGNNECRADLCEEITFSQALRQALRSLP